MEGPSAFHCMPECSVTYGPLQSHLLIRKHSISFITALDRILLFCFIYFTIIGSFQRTHLFKSGVTYNGLEE